MKKIPSQYGHWTVGGTYLKPRGSKNRRVAICYCKCGTERHIFVDAIHGGKAGLSCGCEKRRSQPRTHGHTSGGTPSTEYRSWYSMKRRCYDPTTVRYERWGGRSIEVCDRWRDSFENFLADMGLKPSPKHSIERRDNDANYCPENCFWASPTAQSRNTCRNRLLTYNGKTMSAVEWAEEVDIHDNTIRQRIDVYGWSVEKALTTPVRQKQRGPRVSKYR